MKNEDEKMFSSEIYLFRMVVEIAADFYAIQKLLLKKGILPLEDVKKERVEFEHELAKMIQDTWGAEK